MTYDQQLTVVREVAEQNDIPEYFIRDIILPSWVNGNYQNTEEVRESIVGEIPFLKEMVKSDSEFTAWFERLIGRGDNQ